MTTWLHMTVQTLVKRQIRQKTNRDFHWGVFWLCLSSVCLWTTVVICLCSRTHPSSFYTSSGAVHQAVWAMQFKCKFPAMDKDLLKASRRHWFTKWIFVCVGPNTTRQWFILTFTVYCTMAVSIGACISIVNKRGCSKLKGIRFH